ncbi:hypothetical protein Droror1_Dr00000672 [Drosera rotundifolia]
MVSVRGVISTILVIVIVSVVARLFLRRTVRTTRLRRWWRCVSDKFHEHQFLKIPEFLDDKHHNRDNDLYRRVSVYLNSLESIEDSNFTNLSSTADSVNINSINIVLSMNDNQIVHDDFLSARLTWKNEVTDTDRSSSSSKSRSFVLRIRKRDKRRILRPYLQHINAVVDEIEQKRRDLRLYSNVSGSIGRWRSTALNHPATMETIAIESDLKSKIRSDLDSFLKSKQYYHRLGRVWRRSYLLHGPSGTGKSSFVAAIAKHVGYDVYDLDLTAVKSDSDLKTVLLSTTNRSIILLEDFDRFITNTSSNSAAASVTVTGLLNFMDGVANSCCDERIMIFTMTTSSNSPANLNPIEPGLFRPGRVDVSIHFPLCDFDRFKSLAVSYLGVKDHKLFHQVEEIFQTGATLSPAEIGELMLLNRNSPSRALRSVIVALQGSGKTGRRPVSGELGPAGSGEDEGEAGPVGCQDGVKEFRKFYGFLRRKSDRRSESFDLGVGRS